MLNRFNPIILLPLAIITTELVKPVHIFSVEENLINRSLDNSPDNDPILLQMIGKEPSIKIVLSGIGPKVKYQTNIEKDFVEIRLTPENTSKKTIPQSLSIPKSGLRIITLNESNGEILLKIIPSKGTTLNQPNLELINNDVLVDFPNIQISQIAPDKENIFKVNKFNPFSKSQAKSFATAPPLGDIAVGTSVIENPNLIDIEGPKVSLVFKKTPAKDAIEFLISKTDYGFVYIQDDPTYKGESSPVNPESLGESSEGNISQRGASSADSTESTEEKTSDSQRFITLSIKDQPYKVAFNSLLMASGLQATIQNKIVYVGPNVKDRVFDRRISRVYRLNQTTANAVASYLANLGAKVSTTSTITTAVSTGASESESVAGASTSSTTTNSSETKVQVYGSSIGPLVGLLATTDDRLQTITMIGAPELIEIAERYIKQLDLRQRQVALTVRILDINITDGNSFSNSWAFKTSNKFIVNDAGKLLGAFGDFLPPDGDDFGVANSTYANPGTSNDYRDKSLIDFLQLSIASENTKILASPTLILNEYPGKTGGDTVTFEDVTTALTAGTIGRSYGNEAFIIVGSQVPVNCTVEEESTVPQFEYGIAGLTFGARVLRIDDNGYVTFAISPAVSVAGGTKNLTGCGEITLLATRRLDSGSIRIRDGNTLILTGVLNSTDKETVTKVPLLGDLPILGRLFRNTTSTKEQRELVILVTPQIIDGSEQDLDLGSSAYSPKSSEIQKLIRQN